VELSYAVYFSEVVPSLWQRGSSWDKEDDFEGQQRSTRMRGAECAPGSNLNCDIKKL